MLKRSRNKKNGKPIPFRFRKQSKKIILKPHLDTSSKIKVRSKIEQKCVDIFNDYNIEFQYEPLILLSGRQLRPDFFLLDYNLFIEICGMRKMPYYDERYNSKEKLYEIYNLDVILINAITPQEVEKKLLGTLRDKKIIPY